MTGGVWWCVGNLSCHLHQEIIKKGVYGGTDCGRSGGGGGGGGTGK